MKLISIRALLAPLLVIGVAVPRSFADAADRLLDPMDRAMLDPIRTQALRPAELVRRLRLRPTAIVADIGAGPGFLTLPIARSVPRGRVIATDLRPEPLTELLSRARSAGLDNVEIRTVSADSPGLAPRSIDLALLSQVDHYLPDRRRYLAHLVKALRPRGRIALVNYVSHRREILVAAEAVGLKVLDEWRPSSPFLLLVFAPR